VGRLILRLAVKSTMEVRFYKTMEEFHQLKSDMLKEFCQQQYEEEISGFHNRAEMQNKCRTGEDMTGDH